MNSGDAPGSRAIRLIVPSTAMVHLPSQFDPV
jgi:hypothetical protein